MGTELEIRQCTTLEEYAACVELQREVWGFSELDTLPLRAFITARHSGGMTYGGFDPGGRLIGFAHAMAAFDGRLSPYYYSHMLAVRPESRNGGIGHRLKLEQRGRALRLGVPLITWTYDPLQSRNAYLNLVKLGGVVRRYKVNYYGNQSTSALHRGLDTDRLLVEWWVGSGRVERALAGRGLLVEGSAGGLVEPVEKVEIPREIEEVKARDLGEAHQWQRQVREQFLSCFERGLYCTGLETSSTGSSWYLFSRDEREEERQWRAVARERSGEETRLAEALQGQDNQDNFDGWLRPGEDAEEERKETR